MLHLSSPYCRRDYLCIFNLGDTVKIQCFLFPKCTKYYMMFVFKDFENQTSAIKYALHSSFSSHGSVMPIKMISTDLRTWSRENIPRQNSDTHTHTGQKPDRPILVQNNNEIDDNMILALSLKYPHEWRNREKRQHPCIRTHV